MNSSSYDRVMELDGCAVRVVDAPRVASVRERMPAERDLADTAEVFGLLSDPGRLRLLVALLDLAVAHIEHTQVVEEAVHPEREP